MVIGSVTIRVGFVETLDPPPASKSTSTHIVWAAYEASSMLIDSNRIDINHLLAPQYGHAALESPKVYLSADGRQA